MSPTTLEPPGGAGSGEQPVIIDQKTAFRWPLVTAIATAAVLGAGGLAKATDAAETTKTQQADLHAHELRIQRVEDAQAASADALREIKAELKEINRKLDEQRRKP